MEGNNPQVRMKTSLILLGGLLCAGCQSVPPKVPPALPPAVPPRAAGPVVPAAAMLERRLAQQSRLMAAVLEQNDVLAEKLRLAESRPENLPSPVPAPAAAIPPVAAAAPVAGKTEPELPLHAPNADGLIDLSVPADAPGTPVNPFALRSGAAELRREVAIRVQGLAAGPEGCALINGRVFEAGDAVEGWRVERIEPDAVILRGDGLRLRLPPAGSPVRVRLPQ